MATTNLLTLEEAATMLRKTESQMRWLIHAGRAPRSAKIGGRIMFRASDVEAFIESAFETAS